MPVVRPIKVLFLTSSYPRSSEDNAAVFLRNLAQSLQGLGVTIHVLAPADAVAGAEIEDGILVHRFRYFPKRWQNLAYGSGILPNLRAYPWRWVQAPFFVVAMLLSLSRLVLLQRPDIVHAHWAIPQGFVALLAKLVLRIPLITTVHGTDAFAFRSGLIARLREWVIKNSDAWTANSHATSAATCMSIAGRGLIIPMGVRVADFCRGDGAKLREGAPVIANIVLFVGRLVDVKGVDDLVTAFASLSPTLLEASELWIVGDGTNKPSLEEQARTLGIRHRVRFFGAVPNSALPDYYAAADLCVVPSVPGPTNETEAQGVVLLEAFSARTCVVATRTGGIPETVENLKTGILVPPRCPQQLAAAIERLLNDPALRSHLADNAFTKVKESYDWQSIAERFAILYRSLARERVISKLDRRSAKSKET